MSEWSRLGPSREPARTVGVFLGDSSGYTWEPDMQRILAGIETEYGLMVDGRNASDQVEDATEFVRSFDGPCVRGWDYRYESPRCDLRGFSVDRLEVDPVDAQFDVGRAASADHDIRSDRVLPNGARFYNDHGHPEYATPETWSLRELVLHEKAGELFIHRIGRSLSTGGKRVRLYKNNTDYHGASYGTHESYLVPRDIGFERLYRAVCPMLIARQVLCGAGKIGAETGRACAYQISQRADFFAEPFNVETLYRRPVFNTRDEPHAQPERWIRLHVICGDSNMIGSSTARKVGLVKLALALALADEAPVWRIVDPVRAFQSVSRDETTEYRIDLEGRSWTTAVDVLESYFAAAESTLDLDEELVGLIGECRRLMGDIEERFEVFARSVDWAAKRMMLQRYMDEEGIDWDSPSLQAFDLEYHNVDPDEGLFHALASMGEVEDGFELEEVSARLESCTELTRAYARGAAVNRFGSALRSACWRSLTFEVAGNLIETELDPTRTYSPQLAHASDVESFIKLLRGDA